MFPRLYDQEFIWHFYFYSFFTSPDEHVSELAFCNLLYIIYDFWFSFISRSEMCSKMFVCWSFIFSFDTNCIRHEFLSKSEFLMQNHFLNVIFSLRLFETGVINRIRKAVVTFLMIIFEAVTTFSVEKVYFVSKIKMFWPVLSCSGPAGSSYLSTQI